MGFECQKSHQWSGSPVSMDKVMGEEAKEGGSSQTILGRPIKERGYYEYSRTNRKLLKEGKWLDFYF